MHEVLLARADGGGGEGELRGLDRAGAPIHPPPRISRA